MVRGPEPGGQLTLIRREITAGQAALRPRGSLHRWGTGSSVPLSLNPSPPCFVLFLYSPSLFLGSHTWPLIIGSFTHPTGTLCSPPRLFSPLAGPEDAEGDEVRPCRSGSPPPRLAGETVEPITTRSHQCPHGGDARGPGSPGENHTLDSGVREDLWEEAIMLRPKEKAGEPGGG